MSEQAVVKTDAESMTSAEENNAPDLDSLLKEFDKTDSKQESSGEQDLAKRLEAIEQERANERYQSEIKSVAQKIRGDFDHPLLEDKFVVRWLEAEAQDDPRIANAWMQRHKNPEAFDKIIKNLGETLKKKIKNSPDEKMTESRDALASAVRASSSTSQSKSEVNWSSLSDAEFHKEKMKLLAG